MQGDELRQPDLSRLGILGSYGNLLLGHSAESGSLVVAGPADSTTADQLATLFAAHSAIDSPFVARALERGQVGEQLFVSFDCAEAVLLPSLIDAAVSAGAKLAYAGATAFNDLLLDAVEAAHHAPGGPYYLGAMSWDNFVVDHAGRVQLLGFGCNFPTRSARGIVEVPERVLGLPLTASSDVYVLHAIMRSLLPYVALHEMFELAKLGGGEGGGELRALFARLSAEALAAAPEARLQTVDELRRRYREVRRVVPSLPEADLGELAGFFVGLRTETAGLLVDREARTALLGSTRVDLSKLKAPWAIFDALVSHSFSSSEPLAVSALFEAGWPGESVQPEAARARVYVALSALRKAGLGSCILRRDGGWLLGVPARLTSARSGF